MVDRSDIEQAPIESDYRFGLTHPAGVDRTMVKGQGAAIVEDDASPLSIERDERLADKVHSGRGRQCRQIDQPVIAIIITSEDPGDHSRIAQIAPGVDKPCFATWASMPYPVGEYRQLRMAATNQKNARQRQSRPFLEKQLCKTCRTAELYHISQVARSTTCQRLPRTAAERQMTNDRSKNERAQSAFL